MTGLAHKQQPPWPCTCQDRTAMQCDRCVLMPVSVQEFGGGWHPQAASANPVTPYLGFRSTMMTESPLRNILLMKRSLLTGRAPFLPLPVLGICGCKMKQSPSAVTTLVQRYQCNSLCSRQRSAAAVVAVPPQTRIWYEC